MTQPSPDDIWDVLVQECGAPDHEEIRAMFRLHAAEHGRYDEHRFMGALGFGGKLWWWPDRPPTVSCYREDETPERLAMIDRANARLAKLCADPPDGEP